jgi:hypothetical protein
LTIEGFILADDLDKLSVGRERLSGGGAEENLVINTGAFVEGPGALNAQKEPSESLDDLVKTLKETIEGALPSLGTLPSELEIFRIEINHFIYGAGGRTFPE